MYSPWQTAPRASRTIQWVIILKNVRDVIRGNDDAFIVARARQWDGGVGCHSVRCQTLWCTCCTAVHVQCSRAICTRDSAMTHVRASPSSCLAKDTCVLRTDFDFWSLPDYLRCWMPAISLTYRSMQYSRSWKENSQSCGMKSRRASYQLICYIKRIMKNIIIC